MMNRIRIALPALLIGIIAPPAPRHATDVVQTHPLLTPRATHSATLLRDGTVLIVGGMTEGQRYLASAELFDHSSGSFRRAATLPAPRGGHSATPLADGRVLITGGYDGSSATLRTALVYDPATRAFTTVGPMNARRGEHSATLLADGRVLLAGGEDNDVATNSTELFDPKSARFEQGPPMTLARAYHTATLLADGRVLIAGGGPNLHEVTATAEIFDPRDGRFTRTGSMTRARRKMSATRLADGGVVITGGADTRDYRALWDDAERFDIRRGTFAASGAMHAGRFKHGNSAVSLADGSVFVAGGGQGWEVFESASGHFVPVRGAPNTVRYYSTATRLATGEVLIVGGYGPGANHGSTDAWLYSPRARDAR